MAVGESPAGAGRLHSFASCEWEGQPWLAERFSAWVLTLFGLQIPDLRTLVIGYMRPIR